MSTPYIGEIRMFGGNFAPVGWELCNGQLMPIAEYDTLFNLIGTTFGGDGQTTFALPDLRGRSIVHQGQSQTGTYVLGSQGGADIVTLLPNQLPAHSHPVMASTSAATSAAAAGGVVAAWTDSPYSDALPSAALAAGAVQSAGGSQPHDNMPPYQVVTHIISMFGIYPVQS